VTDDTSIAPVRVDVRWSLTQDVQDPRVRDAYESELDTSERARLKAYLRDENKRELILGRHLAREGLSILAGSLGADVAPGAWRLAPDAQGCLRVAAPEELAHLRVNISHGVGMVVCAVTERVDVGIDVEPLDRQCSALEVANRFFSAREVIDLKALPDSRQKARFLEYWTLKEAYIKARGLGLAIPLARFSFLLRPDHAPTNALATLHGQSSIGIDFAPQIDDDPARWRFDQAQLGGSHLMAIAVASGPAAPDIRVARASIAAA
jgi:4'-phosphopantetheinyl transferase